MITASLKVRHRGCVTEKLAGEARAAQVSSDATGDLLVMVGPRAEDVDAFVRDVLATQPRPPVILSRAARSVVVRVVNPPGGVVQRILASGCAIAWPVTYAHGDEHYRVLAASRADIEEAVARVGEVGEVEVVHVTDTPNEMLDITTTIGNLVGDLTRRQLDALRAAIQAGYYATPRRTTIEALAKEIGISQATLSEHLRKAEGRLLNRFAELLAFAPVLASGATRTVGRPRKRPRARR
jgi:predicted DNA binding protein